MQRRLVTLLILATATSCAERTTAPPARPHAAAPRAPAPPAREQREDPEPTGEDAARQRALELAQSIRAMTNHPTVLSFLSEFALACVALGRANRACLEEQLGEPLPEPLWLELTALAQHDTKVDLEAARKNSREMVEKVKQTYADSPDGEDSSVPSATDWDGMVNLGVRMTTAQAALACIGADQGGGRGTLESRLTRPLTDDEWATLGSGVEALPNVRKHWRELRDKQWVEFPEELFGEFLMPGD